MNICSKSLKTATSFLCEKENEPTELKSSMDCNDSELASLLIQLTGVRNKRCKNRSAKLLSQLSQSTPESVIPHWDGLLLLVSCESNIVSWNAMEALGYLAHLKTPADLQKCLPVLIQKLHDKSMVTISHAISCMGKFAFEAPDLRNQIFTKLLKLKNYSPSNDCELVLAGKVIKAAIPISNALPRELKNTLRDFVNDYKSCPRKTTVNVALKLYKNLD